MVHPDHILRPEEAGEIPAFEPVYPLTGGLTQKQMAAHLGTSALSVWKWESGQVTPRARFLPAILALRSQGKREVMKAVASA